MNDEDFLDKIAAMKPSKQHPNRVHLKMFQARRLYVLLGRRHIKITDTWLYDPADAAAEAKARIANKVAAALRR